MDYDWILGDSKIEFRDGKARIVADAIYISAQPRKRGFNNFQCRSCVRIKIWIARLFFRSARTVSKLTKR